MKIRIIALIALVALILPVLSGCVIKTEKQSYKAYDFNCFDTITTIIGYESSEADFSKEYNKILSSLREYHKLFDIYNDYYECSKCNNISAYKNDEDNDKRICKECEKPLSNNEIIANISTINKLVDGEHPVVKVDRKIIDMLLTAKEMYTLTGGKMNVAMGSVLSIWHDYRTAGLDNPKDAELPPMDLLQEAAKHTDINDIIIDKANSTVYLADPKMSLDVGAFAKGYAVEMVARMLEEAGKTGYVLNVGGNIRTVGARANGSKWKTGIENPADTESYIEFIELAGEAIVTSGSYQRFYTVVVSAKCSKCEWVYDRESGIPEQNVVSGTLPSHLTGKNKCPVCGERIRKTIKDFHHIIDSETLMPAEGLLSVSIICTDSGMGDGLSTALFCMSIEDGMTLINSLEGVEALWVDENEVKHYSAGFKDYSYQE